MIAALANLVPCASHRARFPSGVPVRGCLRRQLERKRDGKDWAPAHPACVGCELGHQVRAEVEAAGVDLETCEKDGSAIVGEDGCEACEANRIAKGKPCPACGGVERHAPSGCSRKWRKSVGETTPPTYRGPVSTLVWSGDVPDVPIAAPARHDVGLTSNDERATAARVREALRHPTTVAAPPPGAEPARRIESPAPTTRADTPSEQHHEPPAPPAEEESMPKGKRSKPMECCGSMSTYRHKSGCKEDGKKSPAPAAGGERPRRPRREESGVTGLIKSLGQLQAHEVIAVRDAAVSELKQRLERAESDARALRTAVGEAA